MQNKIWTLEEAREDYKKTKIKICCYNCKFSEIQMANADRGYGLRCNVKERLINDYEIYRERNDCKYFTIKTI